MEHLKNIGYGLLAVALVAFGIALFVAAIILILEVMDWVAMTGRTSLAHVGGVAIGVIGLWGLGRNIRRQIAEEELAHKGGSGE